MRPNHLNRTLTVILSFQVTHSDAEPLIGEQEARDTLRTLADLLGWRLEDAEGCYDGITEPSTVVNIPVDEAEWEPENPRYSNESVSKLWALAHGRRQESILVVMPHTRTAWLVYTDGSDRQPLCLGKLRAAYAGEAANAYTVVRGVRYVCA